MERELRMQRNSAVYQKAEVPGEQVSPSQAESSTRKRPLEITLTQRALFVPDGTILPWGQGQIKVDPSPQQHAYTRDSTGGSTAGR